MTLPSIVHPMYLALNRVNIASIRGWHQEGHPAVNILHHKHTMDSEIISRHCTARLQRGHLHPATTKRKMGNLVEPRSGCPRTMMAMSRYYDGSVRIDSGGIGQKES